jgi:hypothetical protein
MVKAWDIYSSILECSRKTRLAATWKYGTKGGTQILIHKHVVLAYLGRRLPWFLGRSWTRNVCLFLFFLVLYPPLA